MAGTNAERVDPFVSLRAGSESTRTTWGHLVRANSVSARGWLHDCHGFATATWNLFIVWWESLRPKQETKSFQRRVIPQRMRVGERGDMEQRSQVKP